MSKPKYAVGFSQSIRGSTAAEQAAALKSYGVAKVISASEGFSPEDALGVLRARGEMLCIAGPLRILADNRKGIRAIVDLAHSKKRIILDITTGHRSDRDGIAMLDEGLRSVNRERRNPKPAKAVEYGAQGGKEKGRLAKGRRMPLKEAKRLWRSPDLTAEQALELMHGWSRETAYRYLGKRGRPRGRPPGN